MSHSPIKAFRKGEVLYLAMPSSKGGYYIVAAALNKKTNTLFIGHDCPAIRHNKQCWHVKAAVEAFKEWRWWEVDENTKVVSIQKPLVLLPELELIELPGGGKTYDHDHDFAGNIKNRTG